MTPWAPATTCSRAGAAHRRRQVGSQDWAASTALRSVDGQAAQLLVVADGHGGRRYRLSAHGSRLACEVALCAARSALEQRPLAPEGGGLEPWRRWLAEELPQRVVDDWRLAIQRHWSGRASEAGGGERGGSEADAVAEAEAEDVFSPQLYGTTLGLLVLTPHWWGCTGIGDWDLVRVMPGRESSLLSEEQAALGAPGEATGSLCLPDAAAHWRARTALHPLTAGQADFCLLLSTDGIRKSCATDGDFLALAGHLRLEPSQPQLEQLLDQISEEGSGDDVSLGIARWEGGGDPSAPPGLIAPIQAARAGGGPVDAGPVDAGPVDPGTVAWDPVATNPAAGKALRSFGAALPPRGRRRAGLAAALALGAGALVWGLVSPRTGEPPRAQPPPKPAPPLAPPLLPVLTAEVKRQCRLAPPAILGGLRSRRAQFEGLRLGRLQPGPMLAAAREDPLGALIAASFDGGTRTMADGDALERLQLCVALRQALQQQWQSTVSPAPPPRSQP